MYTGIRAPSTYMSRASQDVERERLSQETGHIVRPLLLPCLPWIDCTRECIQKACCVISMVSLWFTLTCRAAPGMLRGGSQKDNEPPVGAEMSRKRQMLNDRLTWDLTGELPGQGNTAHAGGSQTTVHRDSRKYITTKIHHHQADSIAY